MKKLFLLFEKEASLFSVVVFWLSLASISFLFLTDESGGDELFIKKFGTVTYAKSSVRRKKAAKFSWFSIEKNSPLAVNDSIKTGPDSAAIIAMQKGGSIEVGENSLVILRDTGSISNNFIRGSLIIRDASGDRKIEVDESGKRTEENLSYRWISPIPHQEFITSPQKALSLEFKWTQIKSTKVDKKELLFDISKSEKFSDFKTQTLKLDADLGVHVQNLAPGKYYYRLKSAEGETLTETRVVKVTELSPLNVAATSVSTFATQAKLTLSWVVPKALRSVYLSGNHEIEISDSQNFENLIQRQPINPLSGKVLIENLKPGLSYARITSKIKSFELVGASAEINLIKIQRLALTPLMPHSGSVADFNQPVVFQWVTEPATSDLIQYELELREASKTVWVEKLNEPRFSWIKPQEGNFEYVIRAYLGVEKIAESEARSFRVGIPNSLALEMPRHQQSFVEWPNENVIQFQWATNTKKTFENYSLEISREESFQSIETSQKLQVSSFKLPFKNLNEGVYYWRVTAHTADAKVDQSKINSFNYSYPSILSATSVQNLKREYNLRKDKLPVLKWKGVKEALAYEVEVRRLDTTARSPASVVSEKTAVTEFKIPQLKEGDYTVNVWAVDPAQRRGQPYKQKIQVRYGELLKAPKLKKVEVE